MKIKGIALMILVVVAVSLVAPAYVQAQPALPHAFHGTLKINGNDAPVGTTVEAEGEGVITGIMGNPLVTTEAGTYGSEDPLGPKLVVQGDLVDAATIEFYVNGVKAHQTAEWHTGALTQLDLTATIQTPPSPPGGGIPPDTTPPRISSIRHCGEGVTETTADICWTTNEPSTSQIEYWITESNKMLSPLDETMVGKHDVQLTGLTPGTTYHYKTRSEDAAGNLAVSAKDTFSTLEAPATAFSVVDLLIDPKEVDIGESVTIIALISNTGDVAGTYAAILKIDGTEEATKQVEIAAGKSEPVSFIVSKDKAATYTVSINGWSDSFTVKAEATPQVPTTSTPTVPTPGPAEPAPAPTPEPSPSPEPGTPINWPILGGVIGGVIVIGLLIFFLVARRRAS